MKSKKNSSRISLADVIVQMDGVQKRVQHAKNEYLLKMLKLTEKGGKS